MADVWEIRWKHEAPTGLRIAPPGLLLSLGDGSAREVTAEMLAQRQLRERGISSASLSTEVRAAEQLIAGLLWDCKRAEDGNDDLREALARAQREGGNG